MDQFIGRLFAGRAIEKQRYKRRKCRNGHPIIDRFHNDIPKFGKFNFATPTFPNQANLTRILLILLILDKLNWPPCCHRLASSPYRASQFIKTRNPLLLLRPSFASISDMRPFSPLRTARVLVAPLTIFTILNTTDIIETLGAQHAHW